MQSILSSLNNLTKTNKLVLATFAFLAVLAFGGGRAHAASLTVGGGCTLPIAINSVNAGSVQVGCGSNTSGVYGTNDTITLPAGTITLSADLPHIEDKAVSVIGAGKNTTTIDADGYAGFYIDAYPGPSGVYSHVLRDFTITGAATAGIIALDADTFTLENMVVTDSTMGVFIRAIHTIVTNSNIINNTNSSVNDNWIEGTFGSSLAGLGIVPQGASSSDIPSVDITGSVISGNQSESAGLSVHFFANTQSGNVDSLSFHMDNTTISDNIAEKWAGAILFEEGGTTSVVGVDLTLDAVTISGNSVEVQDADPLVDPFQSKPYVSGFIFNGTLEDTRNLTNVTSAYNTIINDMDNQLTVAGFIGSLSPDSAGLTFTNATIVGNEVTQSQLGAFFQDFLASGVNAAFFVHTTDPNAPDINNAASAQNSLVAGNSRNGDVGSCIQGDKSALGLSGMMDLTPTSLGNNITDDPNCTGYTVVSNILSTLGPLQDNGGPVETIALLDGSPAISAGGAVLGVTTDARGIARPSSCVSVGAFQFEGAVCGTSTTNNGTNAGAPNTGIGSVSNTLNALASLVGLATISYTLRKREV